jgi:hypothetical protein
MFVAVKSDNPQNSPIQFYNFEENRWVLKIEEATVVGDSNNKTNKRFFLEESYVPGPLSIVVDSHTKERFEFPHVCESIDRLLYCMKRGWTVF